MLETDITKVFNVSPMMRHIFEFCGAYIMENINYKNIIEILMVTADV